MNKPKLFLYLFIAGALGGLTVVNSIPDDQDIVYFGALITLEDEEKTLYRNKE